MKGDLAYPLEGLIFHVSLNQGAHILQKDTLQGKYLQRNQGVFKRNYTVLRTELPRSLLRSNLMMIAGKHPQVSHLDANVIIKQSSKT